MLQAELRMSPALGYPCTPKAVAFTQGLCGFLYGSSLTQCAQGIATLAAAGLWPGRYKSKEA